MHVSTLDGAEAFVTLDGSTAEHYDVVGAELYFFTAGSGSLRVGDAPRDVPCCRAPAYSNDDTVLTGG